jgi:hypothetical protein
MKTTINDTPGTEQPVFDILDLQIKAALVQSSPPALPDTFTEQVLRKIAQDKPSPVREYWPLMILMGLFPLGGYTYLKGAWDMQLGNSLLGNPALFSTLILIFLLVKLTDSVRPGHW